MKWFYLLAAALVLFGAWITWVWGVDLTTQTAVQAGATLTQNDYRWYSNTDALTPISALAGENASTETPSAGTVLRLRMNLQAGVAVSSGLTFKLQFSNSTSSGFADVGTSTGWIFYNNASVADGATIVTTVLSSSNAGEVYGESNPSAASPNSILASQKGEWDWVIMNNSADTTSNWYFRMIFSSSTVLDGYSNYPTLAGVSPAPPAPGGGSPGGGGTLIIPGLKIPDILGPEFPEGEVTKPPSPCDSLAVQIADLNGDCAVDLVDLSIMLYYYERTGPRIARYDFNNNGAVDFPDISVLMFYWTG